MPAHDSKALWESWQDLWNGNLAVAEEIIAPGFVAHLAPVGNSPGEVRGPEGLKQRIEGSMAAFTDRAFVDTHMGRLYGPLGGPRAKTDGSEEEEDGSGGLR